MKCHVAVLPSPGMGHVIPLLEFAKVLVTRHDVHVSFIVINNPESASNSAEDKILNSANSTLPIGLHVINLPLIDVGTTVTDDGHLPLVTTLSLIVEESYNKSLMSVLADVAPLNAVVVDLITTKAVDICNGLSIPVYSFCTTSVTVLAFCLYLPTLDRNVEGDLDDLTEPIRVPGCSPIQNDDIIDFLRNRTDEYRWFLHHVSKLTSVAGIFANSWEDLEPVAFKAIKENPFYSKISTPPVYQIGPMIKHYEPMNNSMDKKCLEWLDDKPVDSVLLVSLGSGGTLSIEQLTELAFGLELSQQRFIWVVRKPTLTTGSGTFFKAGDDVDEANSMNSYLPDGFIERTRGVGLVVASWVPQVEVLRHEATGGFLSHCGWNSSLESLSNGVPMIACPLYAEQKQNVPLLMEKGVAVKLVKKKEETVIERKEIERVVRMVMEGEEGKVMRCKAKTLKESSVETLKFGGCSYEPLHGLVEEWKLRCV